VLSEDAIEIPIEDWLDLHTFRPRDVADVVEEYLDQAVHKGYPLVRIIHGRGIGVQREMVRQIAARHPDVGSLEDSPDRGATLVYFKPRRGM
jgi:dsDNA-specific endonuclease/ATPase MutS2